MTFNPGSQLDPGQVSDRRGMGGVAIGGGGAIGIILLLAYTLLGGNPNDLGPAPRTRRRDRPGELRDRHRLQDGRGRQRPRRLPDPRLTSTRSRSIGPTTFTASGEQYQPVDTVLFTGATNSGCGTATSASGPFYCPVDKLVYLDLDFFQELRTRFGANAGSLAQGYVVAHEYGHHVQAPRPPPDERRRPDRRREPIRSYRTPGRLLPACGPTTPLPRLSRTAHDARSPTRSTRPRRSATTASRGDAGPGRPRLVDAWLVGPSPEVVHDRLPERYPAGCDTSGLHWSRGLRASARR